MNETYSEEPMYLNVFVSLTNIYGINNKLNIIKELGKNIF